MNPTVRVELRREVALVLFEFLSRFEDGDGIVLQDDAEHWALVELTGHLQRHLAEPFASDYKELLEKARSTLVAQYGDAPA